MPEQPFAGEDIRKLWAYALEHCEHRLWRSLGHVVTLGLNAFDLFAEQLETVELTIELRLEMQGQGFAVDRPQFFQAFTPIPSVRLSLSTLADQIGAIAAAVKPVFLLLEAHTLGAGRLHGDDTTVPRLAKYKTDIARMWTYVCDDAPFAGGRAPAALFYYSRDRKGEHSRGHLTGYRGILQADNYAGYNALYDPGRAEGTITHAACWAHARRYFFELADIATQLKRKPGKRVVISPLAIEAVQRIDRIFAIERDINGSPAAERLAVRQILSAPLVAELGDWMREQRGLLSSKDAVGKKMDYMLNAWPAFTAFLEDGRICLTNNAAERALRAIARGRKAWLFVGSDRGGERAAMMYTLIATCKLNDVDPLVWLTDVLTRIADISQNRLHELLPWTWKHLREKIDTAQAA